MDSHIPRNIIKYVFPLKIKSGDIILDFMTSSDGETIQGETLFKGGHYFPSPFFHMGKLIKGGTKNLTFNCKIP